jgi:hypothetical protein
MVTTSLLLLAAIVFSVRSIGLGPLSAALLLLAVLLVPITVWLAYWAWGYFSLRYVVTRDGLEIRWAASRQVVPMESITRVTGGSPYIAGLSGFHWPGHEVGRAQVEREGGGLLDTLVYATTEPDDQVLVVTHHLAYAISPVDQSEFVEEFKRRRSLGPVQRIEQETRQPRWARLGLWHDWTALRLIAVAALLNALAFAWLVWRFPSLPDPVAIQYRFDPAIGEAVALVSRARSYVWTLPIIGLAVVVANVGLGAIVYSRARLAAVLLAFGAVLTQLALIVVIARLGT